MTLKLRKTYLRRLILTIVITLGCLGSSLEAKHTLTDSEVTIVSGVLTHCTYSFLDKSIIIPDTLQHQAIKEIRNSVWPHVFSDKGLTKIELPSTLVKIGDHVFEDNNSLDIIIPRGVKSIGNNSFSDIRTFEFKDSSALKTIGSYAFKNHSLDSIILPDSIISVGNNAFKCTNNKFYFKLPKPTDPSFTHWQNQDSIISGLEAITDTKSSYFTNLSYTLTDDDVTIIDNTLTACSYDFSKKYITIPDSLDGQEINEINTHDFKKRDIANITLPNQLKRIGQYTFYYNIISTLIIPKSVIDISEGAFYTNLIDTLIFEAGSELKIIEISAFENHNFSDVILPNSLISIGNNAFYSYYKGNFAYRLPTPNDPSFKGWFDNDGNKYAAGDTISLHNKTYYTNLAYMLSDDDVVVENGIIISCSYNHSSKYITIPNFLDNQVIIGIDDGHPNTGVFADKNIYEVFLPNTLQVIGESEFLDLSNNYFKRLTIPASVKRIGHQAFTSRADTLKFESGSQLKLIDNYAFDNHIIKDLTLPNSLIAIGTYAFRCNNSQFQFALPNPQNTEPDFTTWYDDKDKQYQPGDIVTDLSASYYTNLEYTLKSEDVVVEGGVIISCSYDFSRKFITIPEILDGQQITGIDDGLADKGVFQNKNIAAINLPESLQRIGDSEFRAEGFGTNIGTLTIPRSVIYIGKEAFNGCSINKVILQDNSQLISIGTAAFANNDLTGFKLPSSNLTDIGTWGDATEKYYAKEATVTNLETSYAMRWIPVAQFVASPRNVKENFEVKFTDRSLNSPTEWLWHFGDGATSKEQHPIHIYDTPKKYTVRLIAIKAAGRDTLRRANYITVVPDILDFDTHPEDTICAPNWNIYFSATSNTSGVRFRWQSKMPNANWEDLAESEHYQYVDSSTLLVNGTQLTQNQELFRAIIERKSEQDTSNIATLTVLPESYIKVYPNPAKDILNVELVDVSFSIKVSNSLGQLVYTSPLAQQHFSIDLSGWTEKGVYFIHLLNEAGETINVEKLLLQH